MQVVERGGIRYRVLLGTGMGQVHSGSLSDVAFWRLAEMPVLGEADGVLCYLRFRDDIFVAARNREAANKALTVLQGRASKCWKVGLRGFLLTVLRCLIVGSSKALALHRAGELITPRTSSQQHVMCRLTRAPHIPGASTDLGP